jgi:hypothetical protein
MYTAIVPLQKHPDYLDEVGLLPTPRVAYYLGMYETLKFMEWNTKTMSEVTTDRL